MSANDCWTVGSDPTRNGTTLTEALNWNGSAWRVVRTPNPGGTGRGGRSSVLADVACVSKRDCWAVGSYDGHHRLHGYSGNLALHWNGARWAVAQVPKLGTGVDALNGVACAGARSCFAVGSYTLADGAVANEVLHWDGRAWRRQSAPNPGGTKGDREESFLNGLDCTSSTNCWAVGSYSGAHSGPLNQALHWDGMHWRYVSTPNPSGSSRAAENILNGVACASASSCVATGYYDDPDSGTALNDTLRWQGSHWTTTSAPNPAGTDDNELAAVACPTASRCLAVGYVENNNSSESESNDVLVWDGTAWQQANVPNPSGTVNGGQQLHAISCTSASDCWAVGQYSTPQQASSGIRFSTGTAPPGARHRARAERLRGHSGTLAQARLL